METDFVTCISIGIYGHAITKGAFYQVVAEDADKFRIIGNHNKRVWINKNYFVSGKVDVPILQSWKFDDDLESFDFIEVTITFTNGIKRWCLLTTPQRLVQHFEHPNMDPPGFNTQHLIIVKTMGEEDIDRTLRYLDEQGELDQATLPLN